MPAKVRCSGAQWKSLFDDGHSGVYKFVEEESVSVKKASEVNDPDIDLQDVDMIFNRMSSAVLGSAAAVISMPSLPGLVDISGGIAEHKVHASPMVAASQQQQQPQLQTARPLDLASNADTTDEPSGLRLTHWASFRTTASAAAKAKPKANTKARGKAAAKQTNASEPATKRPRTSALVSMQPGLTNSIADFAEKDNTSDKKFTDADGQWQERFSKTFKDALTIQIAAYSFGDEKVSTEIKDYVTQKTKAINKCATEAVSDQRACHITNFELSKPSHVQVKTRKRNLQRRTACPEELVTTCDEAETVLRECSSLLKAVCGGGGQFSGDEALRMAGVIDARTS